MTVWRSGEELSSLVAIEGDWLDEEDSLLEWTTIHGEKGMFFAYLMHDERGYGITPHPKSIDVEHWFPTAAAAKLAWELSR